MEKEYILIKVRYIDGEKYSHCVGFDWSYERILRLYNKYNRKRLKRKGYSFEIRERTVGEWQNVDCERIFDIG